MIERDGAVLGAIWIPSAGLQAMRRLGARSVVALLIPDADVAYQILALNTAMMARMKEKAILAVTSLLSILLLTLHITDDIVRGISKAESSNTALLVLVVFLYGTLVLAERRWGYIITLLVGLFAAAMPVIHMRGTHYPEIAKSTGGFFFVWTLWALGGMGGLTFILSARGLWSLRRGQPK
jgi:hypothetical protein